MGWKGYQVASIQITRGWPQTEAAVVDLRPYQETSHSSDSNSMFAKNPPQNAQYRPLQ